MVNQKKKNDFIKFVVSIGGNIFNLVDILVFLVFSIEGRLVLIIKGYQVIATGGM